MVKIVENGELKIKIKGKMTEQKYKLFFLVEVVVILVYLDKIKLQHRD